MTPRPPGTGTTSEPLPLPDVLASALDGFARHLALERGRSPHTVRAYVGDVRDLLGHAARAGARDLDDVDLAVLRSWLARQRATGAARSTLARRGSSARVFTAWAHRRGLSAADAGLLLAAPRPRRPLPDVLRPDEAARLIEGASGDSPLDLRDRAALELLYATGVRVAELCGLDLDDVDRERGVVRVMGKGSKERSVPFGAPAAAAVESWLGRGRPVWARSGSGPALLLGARGGRVDPRAVRALVHRRVAAVQGAPDLGPHGLRHTRGDPSPGGWSGPEKRPGDARSRYAYDNPDLHPCQHRSAEDEL